MVKNPICGMEIEAQNAAATRAHMGQSFYFCSPGCKKAFDKEPAKYAGKAEDHSAYKH